VPGKGKEGVGDWKRREGKSGWLEERGRSRREGRAKR